VSSVCPQDTDTTPGLVARNTENPAITTTPAGIILPAFRKEQVMLAHHKFLPLIVILISVKIKIIRR
jgi:hypothetical protein